MDTYIVITKLKLEQIEGANTLQMGWYGGMPYAVGKNITEDDLVAVFLPDSQISEAYAKEHDLIGYIDPQTNEKKGGFFAKNRKVRPIKLMKGKIRSVGYVATLESFAFTGYDISKLKEGDSFNELNGVVLAEKFINVATMGVSKITVHKREEVGLKMHPDTAQFYKEVKDIQVGSLLTVSLKLDGCVTANTIVNTIEYGDVEIGWIVNKQVKPHVKAWDTINNTVVWPKVDDWFFNADSDDWYEIELEDGKTITITGNNPVWLPDIQAYREVYDLSVGDVLLTD